MRNGFCHAGNVISRASRAVSPRLKQVSDEEEVQEIEESTSDDEEQDPCLLHRIDHESEIERKARQFREKCNVLQQYVDSFVVHLSTSR